MSTLTLSEIRSLLISSLENCDGNKARQIIDRYASLPISWERVNLEKGEGEREQGFLITHFEPPEEYGLRFRQDYPKSPTKCCSRIILKTRLLLQECALRAITKNTLLDGRLSNTFEECTHWLYPHLRYRCRDCDQHHSSFSIPQHTSINRHSRFFL